jgi:hypothetical protein
VTAGFGPLMYVKKLEHIGLPLMFVDGPR